MTDIFVSYKQALAFSFFLTLLKSFLGGGRNQFSILKLWHLIIINIDFKLSQIESDMALKNKRQQQCPSQEISQAAKLFLKGYFEGSFF